VIINIQIGKKNLAYYCQRLTELNTSKRLRARAEYKPILILSVIDLITQGLIENNQITVSDKLINTFNEHWDILSSGTYQGKDNLHLPFYHLQNDGFWYVKFKPNFVNALPLKTVTKQQRPKSLKRLKEVVEYASLDRELFELLQNQNYRKELTDVLIAAWFSANKKKLAILSELIIVFKMNLVRKKVQLLEKMNSKNSLNHISENP
jgi:putative restriction endonuclease